ncbi:Sar s 28 (heat shock protein 70-like protein 1) [Dinothrombium tinctorium]|uniref:Sar s 28 (Heat shock protein 70-like protein 1) n=1 Tax=Dinothrombium tinctorium TaxID=1965070 RepID=A0A3S4QGE2_9ACAR|nr:Sar s 28 (heat shock protein 70-like protein 1) [Dinothrombium tinctorium]RWS03126.1 Sar s 28 (heat shock protein 70-like protein 1) [Dinothrombium tinctorium]RWS03163.1 Sar s 28 (heat shock protein 70-like protein 1) [Dinothrombium tinctorium]
MSEAASVCGFDVGSENCYVAVARQGGIEIVLNEYSQRSTPAFVCLGGRQREIGVSAKQKHLMNLSNTFFAIKRLVGRQFNEVNQHEKLPFPIEQSPSGEVAVRVWINDEEQQFTATQLLAMLFSKLRQVANMPVDCVINCPSFFSDGQRQALRDAALISGLNPLRIVNDITAVGINYCFYRLANVASEDTAIVAFVDIGQTTTQCGIILFENKKNLMQVLSSEYEPNLGGAHFDELLADNFIEQYKLKLNKRARLRLIAECEKLKKLMSANSNELPINVECLYDDRDFSARMSRAHFEKLAEQYLQKIEQVFRRSLETAKKTLANISKDKDKPAELKLSAVEIVGGSIRIVAIKRLIKEVFGIEASTTLNADEAVCRGCALQCAMLSPSFRVSRDLQIIDYAPYQINCKYWHATIPEGKTYCVNPLFSRGDQMPFTRQIIVNCHSLPMIFELEYVTDSKSTTVIGQYKIYSSQNLPVNGNKVRVRVRLDPNGFVYVSSAMLQMDEKNTKAEVNNKGDNNENQERSMSIDQEMQNDVNSSDKEPSAEQKEKEKEKDENKRNKTAQIELEIESLWTRGKLSEAELLKYKETESYLVLADKNWKERMDARNELEEYVYEWRNRLEEGRYDMFVLSADRQAFLESLNQTQQWLYEDEETGNIGSRSLYVDKLNGLKQKFSDDIMFRVKEYETRNTFLEDLGKAIQMAHKLLESKECADEAKLKQLHQTATEIQQWFDNCHHVLSSQPLNVNPSITTKQIQEQTNHLQSLIRPIMEDIHRKRQEEERKKKEQEEKLKKEKEGKDKGKESSNENKSAAEEPMEVDPSAKTE